MERTKLKKTRTVHLTHPAASYYPLHDTRPQPIHLKNYHGRNNNFFNSPKKTVESSSWSQSLVRGPDPTAPHLKYGVFANRRPNSTRIHNQTVLLRQGYSPHCPMRQNSYSRPCTQDVANSRLMTKKPTHRNVHIIEPPMHVYQNKEKRNIRELSLSQTMHVDIKPKLIMPASPNYYPSSPYQLPRLSVPPISRSPRASLSPGTAVKFAGDVKGGDE